MEKLKKECKFVMHIPAMEGVSVDAHVIKEVIHHEDGRLEPNLRLLYNFKRPFWITKKHYQNHKDKKESEDIKYLDMYTSTQNMLHKEVASRLGSKYIGVKSMRDVAFSPYLYGTEISSSAIIKKLYMDKYPDAISINRLAVLDIEVDINTNELIIISVACREEVYVAILGKIVSGILDIDKQLELLYNKYIPKTDISKNIKPIFEVCDTEIDLLRVIANKLHTWKTDFVAIWNMDYDIPVILRVCKKYNVDPKDIFSDPSIPKELRYFYYKQGSKNKTTESGVYKPLNPQDQWHVVVCPCSFYWIDAMCAYSAIRVGSKTVPGGYSLNNILEKTLGSDMKKLKFEDEVNMDMDGVDWHKYMVANKPLQYIIYNVWDTMSMLELDNKTKDLESTISALAGISSYDIFTKGPKKITDALHYFYLENGRVLGVKEPELEETNLLGLDDWIVMLSTDMIKDDKGKYIDQDINMPTNIRTHVFDMDAVSSYPSNTQAANVSKDTTIKEIIDIDGIDKKDFKLNNINLFFGKINAGEYCSNMFNFPTYRTLFKNYIKKKEDELNGSK